MTWWDAPLVALDLETTATDPEQARIVTAALAVCSSEGIEEWGWVADPGVEIPDEAAAVHGFTTERARAEGRAAGVVVRELVDRTAALLARGWPLVVFNARYDLTVLDRECRRHFVAPLTDRQITLRVICPHTIDKFLDRYRSGSRKLDATCAHYGAVLDSAHDASSDAVAAARLAWCMGRRGRVVRRDDWPAAAAEKWECEQLWEQVRGDLDLLHAFQVAQAAFQARGLAEHFRSQGKVEEAESVRLEWPIIPVEEAAACP